MIVSFLPVWTCHATLPPPPTVALRARCVTSPNKSCEEDQTRDRTYCKVFLHSHRNTCIVRFHLDSWECRFLCRRKERCSSHRSSVKKYIRMSCQFATMAEMLWSAKKSSQGIDLLSKDKTFLNFLPNFVSSGVIYPILVVF